MVVPSCPISSASEAGVRINVRAEKVRNFFNARRGAGCAGWPPSCTTATGCRDQARPARHLGRLREDRFLEFECGRQTLIEHKPLEPYLGLENDDLSRPRQPEEGKTGLGRGLRLQHTKQHRRSTCLASPARQGTPLHHHIVSMSRMAV